jgi:bifunctional DNA-binding transcriptional regulator/antitoxin component of YhaV-PrlF toxin-antitoxin module
MGGIHPLQGTVLKYIDPTEPVAEDDWAALGCSYLQENKMATSTLPRAETIEVSEDYKLVIPPSLAESLGLRPGQKLQAIFYQGRIEIVPEIDPLKARGSMLGLDTVIDPEDDDTQD